MVALVVALVVARGTGTGREWGRHKAMPLRGGHGAGTGQAQDHAPTGRSHGGRERGRHKTMPLRVVAWGGYGAGTRPCPYGTVAYGGGHGVKLKQGVNIVPYDPKKHHRRSIRLKGYDYTSPGAYFVTICTQEHVCIFGDVVDDEMVLNVAGRMVQAIWESIPKRFPTIQSDVHVIMPNHFHAIIVITDAHCRGDPCGRPGARAGTGTRAGTRPAPTVPTGATRRPALGDVVGAFKSITTHEYISGVRNKGWPPFDKRLWQRNYWEHIIRNETAYQRIYQYIENNPASWEDDQLHPNAPANPFNRG